MANPTARYRNRINGEIGVYPVSLAKHFPNLEEVADDTKRLAYVSITQDAIDSLRNAGDDEDFTPDDEPESGEEGADA